MKRRVQESLVLVLEVGQFFIVVVVVVDDLVLDWEAVVRIEVSPAKEEGSVQVIEAEDHSDVPDVLRDLKAVNFGEGEDEAELVVGQDGHAVAFLLQVVRLDVRLFGHTRSEAIPVRSIWNETRLPRSTW